MSDFASHGARHDRQPGEVEATATLIDRARAGDTAARDQLVVRYLPLLKRWAHGRLPHRARGLVETDDLVQVTLVRALEHLEGFQSRREGAFLAYLRRALMNTLRNEIRRASYRAAEPLPDHLPDPRASLLEEVIGREFIDAYEAGLTELPEEMQEAIILRLEFGFGHQEIADAIGRPSRAAARMLVSRALVKLSNAMAAHR